MRRHDAKNRLTLLAGMVVGAFASQASAQSLAPANLPTPVSSQGAVASPTWPTPQSFNSGTAASRRGWFNPSLGRSHCFWSQTPDGSNAAGTTGLPRGRRYYNNRYFNSFNNRYYGAQYGDF